MVDPKAETITDTGFGLGAHNRMFSTFIDSNYVKILNRALMFALTFAYKYFGLSSPSFSVPPTHLPFCDPTDV
jgi:hypothetical protein